MSHSIANAVSKGLNRKFCREIVNTEKKTDFSGLRVRHAYSEVGKRTLSLRIYNEYTQTNLIKDVNVEARLQSKCHWSETCFGTCFLPIFVSKSCNSAKKLFKVIIF